MNVRLNVMIIIIIIIMIMIIIIKQVNDNKLIILKNKSLMISLKCQW